MTYIENKLTYENYVSLRRSVGWNIFSEEQTRKALGKTELDVTVAMNNRVIAMGRLIGDGLYYVIVDVIVIPEYQRQGIGENIINKLVSYADMNTPDGGRCSIQLIAEKGMEAFYIKNGFKEIPHEYCGAAFRKVIYRC